MDDTIARLIFRESGGFTGLQRGCTVEPGALPAAPRGELQSLLHAPTPARGGAAPPLSDMPHLPDVPDMPDMLDMPDMQVYTLELVMLPEARPEGASATPGTTPQHRVLRYPSSDVPEDLSALIGYLRDHARPLKPR